MIIIDERIRIDADYRLYDFRKWQLRLVWDKKRKGVARLNYRVAPKTFTPSPPNLVVKICTLDNPEPLQPIQQAAQPRLIPRVTFLLRMLWEVLNTPFTFR